VLQRSLGPWAWLFAVLAGASHFVQSNAYETGRKTYRRWVYGADWMRQTSLNAKPDAHVGRALSGVYMSISNLANPGEASIEAAMNPMLAESPAVRQAVRSVYREIYAPLVKTSGVLDGNTRTMAMFASMLAGSPLWFFLFEIVFLNVALAALSFMRTQCNARLPEALRTETRLQAIDDGL